MIKNYISLLISILIITVANAQKEYSLQEIIDIALEQSIRSKQIQNKYQNSYWRYFSYKRQFLPSINFDGIIPQVDRSIYQVTLPDGSDEYVNRSQITNTGALRLNQIVPLTGGSFFVKSGLSNINLLDDGSATTFRTTPVEIGYQQRIFGFNTYKWQKKVEPLYFNEAKLIKTEEKEQISIEVSNLFFELISAELRLKNATNNYESNDTIYKIGKGRYGYGKIAENELLQLELSLLNSQMAVERAKVDVEIKKQQMIAFLYLPNTDHFSLKLSDTIPSVHIEYQEALFYSNKYRSDIIGFKRKVIEADMRVAEVKSENRLNLNLYATYGLTQTSDNIKSAYQNPEDQEIANLGIQIPITTWGTGKGRIKQAQANSDLIKNEVEQKKLEFEQTVYKKVAEFNLNTIQLEVSKKAKEVSEQRFFVSKNRYLIGKSNINDLVISQTEKDAALLNYITSLKRYWSGYFDLRKITHYDFINHEVISSD